MEAAHAGEPARRRGALEAARLQFGEIGPDAGGLDGAGVEPLPGQVGEVIVEVAPIGRERVGGRPALRGQHVEIGVHQALRTHRAAHFGCSFAFGMVTEISRGVGSTKVASANIAAKASPARIATTARKRKRVGTSAGPRDYA